MFVNFVILEKHQVKAIQHFEIGGGFLSTDETKYSRRDHINASFAITCYGKSCKSTKLLIEL